MILSAMKNMSAFLIILHSREPAPDFMETLYRISENLYRISENLYRISESLYRVSRESGIKFRGGDSLSSRQKKGSGLCGRALHQTFRNYCAAALRQIFRSYCAAVPFSRIAPQAVQYV